MKRFFQIKKEIIQAVRVGWFLALRQVMRSGKGTTVLIIFIMVLTFLNLVVVSGLLIGLIAGSFEQFKQSYSGDVIITSAPLQDYIKRSQEIVSYLKSNPKVKDYSARYVKSVNILGTLNDLPGKDETANRIGIRLVGFDPVAEERMTRFSRFVTYGDSLSEGEEGGILVGANMIKKYSSFADANIPGLDLLNGVETGSRVRVTLALSDGLEVKKDFIVKGLVKSKVDEISTRAFITDKELRRLLPTNNNEFQEIAIKTETGYAPLLVEELTSYLGDNLPRIQTSEDAIPSFLRNVEATMGLLGNALSSFALVVASITIFIVVFINAVTKKKFIGIMKGIGISPLAVEVSYIFQAFFYGLVGSAIGLFLTFAVLQPYFNVHPINFPFSDGILVATYGGAFLRVVILLSVTLLAGYIPAKIIVRKNTLDSILGR